MVYQIPIPVCPAYVVADILHHKYSRRTNPVMQGKLHFSKAERAAMHHVKQWGFVDVFRKMNGDVREFSWWDFRAGAWQKNHGLRIDHIWTSPSLADKCTGCWIDKAPRALEKPSDHAPVIAEFEI